MEDNSNGRAPLAAATSGRLGGGNPNFVTPGVLVDLDARAGGQVSNAIRAGKREVIAVLAKRLPVKRYLRYELPLICQWVRLAIRHGQHDIFGDLLERHSDVVKNSADVNYPLLFASMIYWDEEEPDDTFLTIILEWVAGLQIPLRSIWKLKRFNVGGRRHPLYLAFQRQRFDLVDIFFALGASLQDRPSGHRTVLQIIFNELNRNEIWRLIEAGLAVRPIDVISMDDVVSILLNWNHQRSGRQPDDVEPEMFDADYACLVGWSSSKAPRHYSSPRRPRRLLKWKRPFYGSNTKLWATIFRASQVQERRLCDGRASRHPNLVLHAALQSNWAAVRCLLDLNFSRDGTGSYWYRTAHHGYRLPLKPLDVATWTVRVPEDACTESGLQLKRSNAAIAALLIERGASQSGAYAGTHLIALPFLEIWEYLCAEFNDVTQHHSRIGLIFSIAGFMVGILLLWLLWYLAELVSGFTGLGLVLYALFYLVALPNIVLVCWAVFWLPLKVIVRGHRKRAYARLVHGGSLSTFWTVAIGQENVLCRLLGKTISGWGASTLTDFEEAAFIDDEFGQQLADEYDDIVRAPINAYHPDKNLDGMGTRKETGLSSGGNEEEEDMNGGIMTVQLAIGGKKFSLTVGSASSHSNGHGATVRRRVHFENGYSSSETDDTPRPGPPQRARPRGIVGSGRRGFRRSRTGTFGGGGGGGGSRTGGLSSAGGGGPLGAGARFSEPPIVRGIRASTTWNARDGPPFAGYGSLDSDPGPHQQQQQQHGAAGFSPGSFEPRSADPGDAMMSGPAAWNGHELQWRMYLMNTNLG